MEELNISDVVDDFIIPICTRFFNYFQYTHYFILNNTNKQ
jgi:hypothetical protein